MKKKKKNKNKKKAQAERHGRVCPASQLLAVAAKKPPGRAGP